MKLARVTADLVLEDKDVDDEGQLTKDAFNDIYRMQIRHFDDWTVEVVEEDDDD